MNVLSRVDIWYASPCDHPAARDRRDEDRDRAGAAEYRRDEYRDGRGYREDYRRDDYRRDDYRRDVVEESCTRIHSDKEYEAKALFSRPYKVDSVCRSRLWVLK